MSSTDEREGLDLGGGLDQAHLVAHPLHQRAGDGDGALQGVDRLLVADPVADGGEQAVVGVDRLVAGVHQQEGAGAVRGLGLALGEAGLAEQRGLLVAERGGDRHAVEDAALGVCRRPRRRSGSPAARRPGRPSTGRIFVVPLQGVQVHQHGARGVGDVGDVHAAVDAAGEVPDDPGVHGAEEDVAALGALAQALDVVEQPADLRAGEVARPAAGRSRGGSGPGRRCGRAPCRARRCGCPARRWRCARARRCSCPTAAVVSRWLVMPIALTSAEVMPGLGDGAVDDLLDVRPDLGGVVLDPARLGEDLLVLLLVDGDDPAVLVEDDAAAGRGALVDGRDERAGGVCVGHGVLLVRSESRVGGGSGEGDVVDARRRGRRR